MFASSTASAQPAPVFKPPVTFTAGSDPFGLAVADIDLDGDLDVAVSHFDNTVWVYQNKGAATWATTPGKALKPIGIYAPPTNCGATQEPHETPNLTFGHFEFDGHARDSYPDLAATARKRPFVWYLRNTANTGPSQFVNVEPCVSHSVYHPVGILAADFDGDSYDDVVVAGHELGGGSQPRIGLIWNNAGGTFTNTVVDAGTFVGRGYAIDLVHIGGVDSTPETRRDIAMSDPDNARTYIFRDEAGETISFLDAPDSTRSRGITAAILNTGDSHWDLAQSHHEPMPHNLRWLENSGTAFALNTFAYSIPDNFYPHGVDSGHLNNDAWVDVVVANEGWFGYPGSVSIFVNNNGNESSLFPSRYDFQAAPPGPGPTPVDTGPVQVLLADLDGDGHLDIITSNSRDDSIGVLINDQ